MKRGAIVAALAAIILLAVVWTQNRGDMGSCNIEHRIIAPDGTQFAFTGPRIQMGNLEAHYPLEGEGMPPIEHLSQGIYGMPGALYRGIVVKPRVLTISLSTHGITREALHDIKAKVHSIFRWDRGEPGEPSIYRYTINGVSRDLCVYFDAEITRTLGAPGLTQIHGVRLLAFDPFWYSPVTEEQVLDFVDSYTMRSIAAKIDGIWDPLGPPAAVGGNREPNTIVKDPETGDIIVGGSFTGWGGLPGVTGNYVARYDVSASAWVSMAGGLNGRCYRLYWGPDGELYAAGNFQNGSGGAGDPLADYIARWNRATDTWVNVGGGPGAGAFPLTDIVILGDGTMVLSGAFANWDAMGADNIVALPLPYDAGAWVDIGTPDAYVQCLEVGRNGNLFAGGGFANIGAVAAESVAEYDPVAGTWAAMGDGITGVVYDMAVAQDGRLYIAGDYVALGGGEPMFYITCWTGSQYTDLDGGMDAEVYRVAVDDLGDVYAAGAFQQAGSLTTPDGCARWNGFSWAHLDIDPPGNGGGHYVGIVDGDILLGFDTVAGPGLVAGHNSVVNTGNTFALPLIEVKNAGLLQSIRNETMGYDIPCDMLIQDGEIVTIDLSSGVKNCESNWRGNRLGDILPASDMATFCLESFPRANYGGVEGANLITVFITGADPRESGDNLNQLSYLDSITGISQANTDWGRLYADIVADGGGFYHVNLYKDTAKAAGDLVAHTASQNAPGAANIVPDNASGLGGQVGFNPVGADTDIQVWFTIVTMFWRNRWWDLDSAVS